VGAAGMAGAAGAAGVLKSVLIGAASAGLLVASYAALGPESPAPTAPEPAVTVLAPSNPEAAPTSAQPRGQPQATPPVATDVPMTPPAQPQVADPAAPRPGRVSPSPTEAAPPPEALAPAAAPPEPSAAPSAQPLTPAERANQLREESRLLGEARDALRRGDASGALQTIEEARARFGGGMLGQEREALTIEALYKSGQKGAASARAAAFLQAYPMSPHAARLQSFLQ